MTLKNLLFGLFIITFINAFTIRGQNLIKNASFEEIDSLAVGYGHYENIFHCKDWFHTYDTWSVDFFHPYMPAPYTDPPTLGADMYSYAQDQNGFLGLVFYLVGFNAREVASSELIVPLMKDSIYSFSMYFKNSDWYQCDYGIDNIGVCFTQDTITYQQVREIEPVIRTNIGYFNTENNWVELKGWFKAQGGEKFINIGSFGADELTNGFFYGSNPGGSTPAYYFIDHLSLEHCPLDEISIIQIPNVFTPNGDGINDILKINFGKFITLEMSVYNRWGVKVKSLNLLTQIWDGTNNLNQELSEGQYFVLVDGTTILDENIQSKQIVTLIR